VAGIDGPESVGVKGLIKTDESHPRPPPRVSVTTTGAVNVFVNVEGKLTVPRFTFEGAEIVSVASGTLLITVRVNCVVAASAENVPIKGVPTISVKANTL
jgi:hypothetical protein